MEQKNYVAYESELVESVFRVRDGVVAARDDFSFGSVLHPLPSLLPAATDFLFMTCKPIALSPEDIARFWETVEIRNEDECWNLKESDGWYGRFYSGGIQWQSHRVAFWITDNSLRTDQCVRHKCDNPSCCNPRHLLSGTHLDNMRDRNERGRNPKLEKHGRALLTNEQAIEVMRLWKPYEFSQRMIAEILGVSRSAVAHICCGNNWTEVTGVNTVLNPKKQKQQPTLL